MNTDVKNGRQKEKAEEEELNNWTQTPPGCYQILPHDIYRSRRPTKALNFFVVRPTDTKGTKIVDGITDHFVEHMICRNYDEYEGTDENEDDKYVLCGQETLFQSIEDDEILSHRDIKVVGLSCQAYIGENKSIGLTNKIKLPTLKEPMLDGKTMKELNENENTKDIFYFARLKAGTDLGDKYVYHFDNKLSRQGEATGHGTLTPASRWNNLTRDTNPDVEYYHLNEEDLCNLDWEYVGLFSFKAGCVPFFNLPFDDDDLVFAVEVIIETQITLDDVLHIYDIIDAIKGGDIDASVELCDILRNESYCFITHEEIQRRDNAIIFLREFHQKEQSENEVLNYSVVAN